MNNMQQFKKNISVFLSYFIYSMIVLVPLAIFNIDFKNLSQTTKSIYLLVGDILFMLLLIKVYIKELKQDIKDYKKNYKDYIDESLKCWVIGLAIMTVSNVLISRLSPVKMAGNEQAVRTLLTQTPIYMIFGVAIFAPIVEELIFRKSLRGLFNTKWLYIIMSGAVFGSLHIATTLTNYYELLYIIPYGALGSAFAYLYYKTDNIMNSIIMHAIHNTSLIILFFTTK